MSILKPKKPRYDPPNTVMVQITHEQLYDLTHGVKIEIEPPSDRVVHIGAFGGRLWINQWYMPGNGWKQRLLGRPRFEDRTIMCRDHSREHRPEGGA